MPACRVDCFGGLGFVTGALIFTTWRTEYGFQIHTRAIVLSLGLHQFGFTPSVTMVAMHRGQIESTVAIWVLSVREQRTGRYRIHPTLNGEAPYNNLLQTRRTWRYGHARRLNPAMYGQF
jgi:hypothetical protein